MKDSFTASLHVVELYVTLAIGGLAFSIGLTTQSTNNYPGGVRDAIIVDWVIFLVASGAGLWAQQRAITMIKDGKSCDPGPNDLEYRTAAVILVVLFFLGVMLLGAVLIPTARTGAPGIHLAVNSPAQAISIAMRAAGAARTSRVTAIELIRGADPVRIELASWHVSLDMLRSGNLDVFIDPVSGCSYIAQRSAESQKRCSGF